jgi:hypothetical protein
MHIRGLFDNQVFRTGSKLPVTRGTARRPYLSLFAGVVVGFWWAAR